MKYSCKTYKINNKLSGYVFTLSLSLMIYGFAAAQDVTLKASVEKDTILIGDQVQLSLEVQQAKGFDVEFPVHQDTLTGNIEIVNILPPDTIETEEGWLKQTNKYVITSFDSGTFTIPPFRFVIRSNQGTDTIYSSEINLTVNTLPVSLNDPIKDIKDIYGAPITFRELFPLILIVLAAALVLYALYYVIKKIKRKEPVLPRFIKPKEPADVIALRELDKLKAQKLWQQGRVKEYYSILTEIIRIYIEDRFMIMAMEQTSEEILLQFKETEYGTGEEYIILKEMFTLADLVKFAKGEPLASENEKHISNAYTFVNNTTPAVIEEEEDNSVKETKEDKVLNEENI